MGVQRANKSKVNGTSVGPWKELATCWMKRSCMYVQRRDRVVKTWARGTGTDQQESNSQGRLEVWYKKGHALKAAVCTGQTAWRVMSQETYVGDFLHSFRKMIRGSHDLLKRKPSSLLTLLGPSSISMVRSMCPELVTRMLVSWRWTQWRKTDLCSAMAD
jgi:hypothetical protein